MKRLTFYDDFNEPCYRLGNIVYSNKIAARLASYEDTGLEPEEIRMIQQIKEFDDAHQFSPVDEELEEKCVTNAGKIRQMSDEELAKWLRGFAEKIAKQSCEVYTMDADFEKDTLDWLKQEVEDD